MNKLTIKELELLHNLVADDIELGKEDGFIDHWSHKIIYQLKSIKMKLSNEIIKRKSK